MTQIQKQLSNGQWQWLDESIPLLYNFNILLTAPPDPKEIRFNNAVNSSVTNIFIHDQEDSTTDISSITSMLQIGDVITLRNKNDTTKFVLFSIDGDVVDNTSYFTIPVSFEADGGFNFAGFDELSISFYSSGDGGSTFDNVTVNGQLNSPFDILSAAAATINTDLDNGMYHRVVLLGNGPYTLADPTNLTDGSYHEWWVDQDATGGRLMAFGPAFKFPGGSAPIMSVTALAGDRYGGVCDGTVIRMGILKDYPA